jgi:transcriptional regulator NrdR family protein
MNRPQVFIVKTDGTKEPFDSSKLENSLKKAGASAEVTEKICHHISKEIEDGMSTSRKLIDSGDLEDWVIVDMRNDYEYKL